MSPDKLNHKRIFTPSEDALIREQPVTGMGLNTLATLLGVNRGALMRRAVELGVSLLIYNDRDETLDTRTLHGADGAVDPLLERLKQLHGERK